MTKEAIPTAKAVEKATEEAVPMANAVEKATREANAVEKATREDAVERGNGVTLTANAVLKAIPKANSNVAFYFGPLLPNVFPSLFVTDPTSVAKTKIFSLWIFQQIRVSMLFSQTGIPFPQFLSPSPDVSHTILLFSPGPTSLN